ncbi:MAG: HU family DNA-binding protein [Cyanobacteria bacterium NC_groundwater_1444_Ag_S-0.65um_54_12]|nr:HU family DNA-binding protein [Cyanobacteria bacterium NC_groundwater_1444_Ag_S-0.65um_54_12]
MNKEELVKSISARAKVSQKDAATCLNATLDVISRALMRGQKVTLVGFGSFSVRERAAREGRNPRTGAVLKIPAKRAAVWTAGKNLKERVETRHRRHLATSLVRTLTV